MPSLKLHAHSACDHREVRGADDVCRVLAASFQELAAFAYLSPEEVEMLIFMNSPGADLLSQMTAEDDSSQETLSDSTLKPSDRKTKRRERNRVAAQKSRKKQTERADVLHQELETLEKSNLAYLKEIENLKKEINHYNDVLREHESKCLLQNPDVQDLNMLRLGKNEVTNEMDILSLCLSDLIYPVS